MWEKENSLDRAGGRLASRSGRVAHPYVAADPNNSITGFPVVKNKRVKRVSQATTGRRVVKLAGFK